VLHVGRLDIGRHVIERLELSSSTVMARVAVEAVSPVRVAATGCQATSRAVSDNSTS